MQLTIDVTPALLRSAGVKNHIYYWTEALQRSRGVHEIRYYPFVERLDSLDHDRGLERGIPNWRLFLVAASNFPGTHWLTKRLAPRSEILHGSPQLRMPPRAKRLTSHIHDLTCWLFPEMHTGANVRAAHQLAEHVWSRANGLIAVSDSAKQDATRLLGIPEEKIQVIYHGIPETYFSVTAEEIARVRSRFSLRRPYVLVVGTVEPRKNLERLLDAWRSLPADVREEFELVIAGPAGWKSETTIARLRDTTSEARYLGYVREQDLPGLTAGARVLAYPSLYEGFGFPLAQAMAAGVPSITSNISSMPEIAGSSALYVDPHSEHEIGGALLCALTSPSLRVELGENGRRRAQQMFRWERAARESWAFFERIVG